MKEGWEVKKLGDLCQIELGKTPFRGDATLWDSDNTSENIWLSIADLLNTEGNVIFRSKEKISDKAAKISKIVKKGTLLLSFKLTLGRVAFAGCDLYTNEAIAALKIDESVVDKLFLYHFFSYFDWNAATEGDEKIKGKTLNKAKLKEIDIHYPKSLTEQKRIVAILDQAFEAIAKAKANAEQNLKNAKELFESYLNEIFENKGDGWEETILEREIDLITGFAFKSKNYTDNDDDILLIRGDNIMQGFFRWEDVKRWNKDEYSEYSKYELLENDILLAMDRPWVKSGLKCVRVSKRELPALLVQRTACLRNKKSINNTFLYYVIQSQGFMKYLIDVQTGIGVPHISGKQILNFSFSKPKSNEQQTQIVKKLDKLRAETQKLEAIYKQKIEDLEELKKSILQKAFVGQPFAGELKTVID